MQDQSMVDPATGKLDPAKLKEALNNIRKSKGEQRDMINSQIVEPQKLTSVSTKYFSLLTASAYYPSWMEESDKKDKTNFANISYVGVAYSELSDSTYKVSDAEIQSYVQKHKDLFKQDAGRKISYVTFSQLPNAEDSGRVKDLVASLKNEFTTTENVKTFLARNPSVIDFDTNFLPKVKIQSPVIDSITKLSPGAVVGPYVDKGSYVLAKLIATKTYPDSIRARHILVPTNDPKTGQPTMVDSVGKNKADSILAAIKAGADFVTMAKQFGTDGTKDKGGDLGFFGYSGPMVEEFNQALFGKPVGTLEVIRTRFGYHVIEITAEKGSQPAYKVAFMAKEVIASEQTINKASNEATKVSAEKDSKKIDAYLQKNGLQKITSNELIKENDGNIGQMQDARQLVRWVFEANLGDVSEPFSIGEQFVVAIVDKIEKEGTQDVQTARPMAEAAVRNEKKTVDILKKLGANPTLESTAAAYNKQVLIAGADSSITFTAVMINNIGQEPKIIGASFNKDYQSKASAPIIGKTGVYLIKVNSIGSKATGTPEAEAAWRTQQLTGLRNQSATNWFEALKKKASITDNQLNF
jgi:peptidyl-prolyl cis-trans isomerase D